MKADLRVDLGAILAVKKNVIPHEFLQVHSNLVDFEEQLTDELARHIYPPKNWIVLRVKPSTTMSAPVVGDYRNHTIIINVHFDPYIPQGALRYAQTAVALQLHNRRGDASPRAHTKPEPTATLQILSGWWVYRQIFLSMWGIVYSGSSQLREPRLETLNERAILYTLLYHRAPCELLESGSCESDCPHRRILRPHNVALKRSIGIVTSTLSQTPTPVPERFRPLRWLTIPHKIAKAVVIPGDTPWRVEGLSPSALHDSIYLVGSYTDRKVGKSALSDKMLNF